MIELALITSLLWASEVDSLEYAAPGAETGRTLRRIYSTRSFRRPVRKDEPLREGNITDIEVREIEAVVRELFPASLVYISAVISECPCEDGPDCTAQVWSSAQFESQVYEVSLSRIDGQWQVGPLQAWWHQRARITASWRESRDTEGDEQDDSQRRLAFREYMDRLAKHNEAYPRCSSAQ